MASDNESFFAASPASADGSAHDDGFFAPSPPEAQPQRRAGGRQGRSRPVPVSGDEGVWLVRPRRLVGSQASSSAAPAWPVFSPRQVLGVGMIGWSYEVSASGTVPNVAGELVGGSRGRSAPAFGCLEYWLTTVWLFEEPCDIDNTVDEHALPHLEWCEEWAHKHLDAGLTLGDLLDSVPTAFTKAWHVSLEEVPGWSEASKPVLVKRVALGAKVDRSTFPVDAPPPMYINRWRSLAGATSHRARAPDRDAPPTNVGRDAALALPRKRPRPEEAADESSGDRGGERKKPFDAIKLLNACAFANHLRSFADFSEAMLDSKKYDENESEEEVVRDRTHDPSKTSLHKNIAALDIVGMQIERRNWHEEVANDQVQSINCYSDASPVCGTEIQGMICDVCKKDKTVRRVTLPGATLCYGQTDAISKMMAFLWAVWLVFGPTEMHMRYFVDHTRCWTTDFGTENHSIELPDCLRAFLLWISGVPLENVRGVVDFSRRLFCRALRVGGWNHSLGNIMKRVFKTWRWWPETMDSLRCLVRFFKNHTWTSWIVTSCKARVPGLEGLLLHFTASTAKWRFETYAVVLQQLGRLRQLCEREIKEELFAEVQDKELLRDVVNACRDARLWIFIVCVSAWVMQPLEHIRRWGMICGHARCNELRKEGKKHVECRENGRRLRDAWEWIQLRIVEFQQWARTVTLADCEGNGDIWELVKTMCKKAASELRLHFKHYAVVPWAFARADTVAGALDCVTQIRARPLEDHDPVTRDFVGRVGADLESRSQGGELTTALEDEVGELNNSMLNESPGEGYHRETNLEQKRAPGSHEEHLKQKVRIKGVIKTCRKFCRVHGEKGREVLRYEWRHYARILQTQHKRRWRIKRMKRRAFYRRIYHQDEKACENWSSILTRVPLARPVVMDGTTNTTQVQNEYYNEALKPHAYYSVDHPVSTPVEDGSVREVTQTDYFYVVSVSTGRTREHVMHTVQTADDIVATSPFVVEVEMLDRWSPPDTPDDGVLRVYTESEPLWVAPEKIAPFSSMMDNLWSYRPQADNEHNGCIVLTDRTSAKPDYPITDPRMPTCLVLAAVEEQGWTPHKHLVRHTALLPEGGHAQFDSRLALRQKWYLQTLAVLRDTLPLCGGTLPSVQPVTFYKLLLRGEGVMPDLGSKHYVALWNKSKKTTKHQFEAIENCPPSAPIENGEEFFGSAPGELVPKAKPRPSAPRGPTVGRGGRGSGRGRGGAGGDSGKPPEPKAALPLPAPRPEPPAPNPGEGGGDEFFEDGVVVPHGKADKRDNKPDWIDSLFGIRVCFDPYITPAGVYEPNWQMYCVRTGRTKRRGCAVAHESHHGIVEPLAFLHAWHDIDWPTKPTIKSHTRETPRQEAVDRIVADHRAALEEVCRRAGR